MDSSRPTTDNHNMDATVAPGAVDDGIASPGSGRLQWLAWLGWCVAFAVAGSSVAPVADASPVDRISHGALGVGVLAMASIGAVVVSRGSAPRPGWLLVVASALWSVYLYAYHLLDLIVTGDLTVDPEATRAIIAVGEEAAFLAILALLVLFVVVPDGQVPPGPGLWVVRLAGGMAVPWTVQTIWLAGAVVDVSTWIDRPTLISLDGASTSPLLDAVTLIFTILSLPLLPLVAAALIGRFRQSAGEERQQLKWVLFGGVAVLIWLTASVADFDSDALNGVQSALPGVAMLTMATTFGLALFRYRLWEVDLVVRRSLVYGSLWTVIALAYGAVAAGLGLFAGTRLPVEVAIVLTIVATLVFQPARRRLEALADRWVFGDRAAPVLAIQTLGTTAAATSHPDVIASKLADAVVQSLRPAWVEVELDEAEVAARGTRSETATIVTAVEWGSVHLGELRCQARAGDRLSHADLALLQVMAGQAALALSHARLLSRIVDAQEIERRRIERDIHDGAQQDVATLIGKLGLARERSANDPVLTGTLGALQDDARRILAGIRDLAQGIHPSVLRDRGLVAAIEDRRSSCSVALRLDSSETIRLRRFDPAIEAAVYFTVTEALNNVVKHAGVTSVILSLDVVGESLRVEVIDQGQGFVRSELAGSGITGMADRIEAVGGVFDVESTPGLGTRVCIAVPVGNRRRL